MPDPATHPDYQAQQRVAINALIAGVVIMLLKFGVYTYTNSAAVLSDALESVINIVAAAFMLYSVKLSNRPADRDHPYGHGKIEFMVVGLEGWLILLAGFAIVYSSLSRIWNQEMPTNLTVGSGLLFGIGILGSALAFYVWSSGKQYQSDSLIADGKHLFADVASTLGVFLGLLLVQYTGWGWLDPFIALAISGVVFYTSWQLLWKGISGLMDRLDLRDDQAVRSVLDDEVSKGTIKGYHKLRLRHNGAFHWVDVHLQVDGDMTVRDSHALVSKIEYRIEKLLGEGQANATAHVEPPEAAKSEDGAANAVPGGAADAVGISRGGEAAAQGHMSPQNRMQQQAGGYAYYADPSGPPPRYPTSPASGGFPSLPPRAKLEPDGPIPLDGDEDPSHAEAEQQPPATNQNKP